MTGYIYCDTEGVERVVRARSLDHARSAIYRVELARSESIAAAAIAADSARVYNDA